MLKGILITLYLSLWIIFVVTIIHRYAPILINRGFTLFEIKRKMFWLGFLLLLVGLLQVLFFWFRF